MSSTLCTNGKPNAIGPNNVSSLLKKSLGYYYVREGEKGEGYSDVSTYSIGVVGHTHKKKRQQI